MASWFHIFPKTTGLSPYVWIVFCILPFYFIFRSSSLFEIIIGSVMTLLFFAAYRLSYLSHRWPMYVWVSLQIVISIAMTSQFGYVYFSLFIAYFIGNIRNKAGFWTMYIIQLVAAIITVNLGLILKTPILISQIPFILINVIGVILIPINVYSRNKQGWLEEQLEDANKKISELVKLKERQRIARDLHDTLGQKLSLIGLKSDLAGKLLTRDIEAAREELKDIRQTARTALKEVREMVADMRGTRLEEEVIQVEQILGAAGIDFVFDGKLNLKIPLLVENVLSMCLKEAVNNIVKHSGATICTLEIEQSREELLMKVGDNGRGTADTGLPIKGNGLLGMKERLEFVNGSLEIQADQGMALQIRVPNVIRGSGQEEIV